MKIKLKTLLCRYFSKYGLIPLICAFVYNCLVYAGCSLLTEKRQLHNLAVGLDEKIPLIPWTILIYFGCYLFWIVNYTLIYRKSREKAYRFFVSDFLSRTICLVCFLVYPTTLERPVIQGGGVCEDLLQWLYRIDAPVNLFPSIHCLVSWNCYIGIRDDVSISVWYRRFSAAAAILVFISTLTTKQHVIVDVAGGVLVSEVTYWLGKRTEWWRYAERRFDQAADRLLSGECGAEKEKGDSLHRVL